MPKQSTKLPNKVLPNAFCWKQQPTETEGQYGQHFSKRSRWAAGNSMVWEFGENLEAQSSSSSGLIPGSKQKHSRDHLGKGIDRSGQASFPASANLSMISRADSGKVLPSFAIAGLFGFQTSFPKPSKSGSRPQDPVLPSGARGDAPLSLLPAARSSPPCSVGGFEPALLGCPALPPSTPAGMSRAGRPALLLQLLGIAAAAVAGKLQSEPASIPRSSASARSLARKDPMQPVARRALSVQGPSPGVAYRPSISLSPARPRGPAGVLLSLLLVLGGLSSSMHSPPHRARENPSVWGCLLSCFLSTPSVGLAWQTDFRVPARSWG